MQEIASFLIQSNKAGCSVVVLGACANCSMLFAWALKFHLPTSDTLNILDSFIFSKWRAQISLNDYIILTDLCRIGSHARCSRKQITVCCRERSINVRNTSIRILHPIQRGAHFICCLTAVEFKHDFGRSAERNGGYMCIIFTHVQLHYKRDYE